MRIHAIHIEHLLSFETFSWDNLDPHLNVIVGPNGVGKTNLFHALRAICDSLSIERRQATTLWANAGHRGTNADTVTIEVELELTTTWEQEVLGAFFAAVLCDQQEIQHRINEITHRGLDPTGLRQFAVWVHEHLRVDDLAWLFRGRLIATYGGRWGWQCRYEASRGSPRFQLDLTGGGSLTGTAENNSNVAEANWGSLFVVWRNRLTEHEREQLDQGLTGVTQAPEFPLLDFSEMPAWVSSQNGVTLQIGDSQQIVDPMTLMTSRAFFKAAQLAPEPRRVYGMRFVFEQLLGRALVFTDNVRLPPLDTFDVSSLLGAPLDLSNGQHLASFLFRKKNGDLRDRQRYEQIQTLFEQMTGRRFDVVLGSANAENAGQTERAPSLELVTISLWGDMPLAFSGAGIAEALYLSAVLAGSEGQIVLLDEPALNLHPTMQATVLQELEAHAQRPEHIGSQFLVNTHIPALVPADAIERVSRFTLQAGQHTKRRALNDGKIDQDTLDDLKKLLRGNLAARAFLFSRAVLLVEGETELAALPVWCPDLVRQDIALYEVKGKGNFVALLRLLQHFAIPWAILGDADLLWDRHQKGLVADPLKYIRTILTACNQPMPVVPGSPGHKAEDFVEWRQALEAYGIFTLASTAYEAFEHAIKPEIPAELWVRAEAQVGSNKVACSRFIAENSTCPKKVATLMRRLMLHLHKREADIRIPAENSYPSSGVQSED